MARCRPLRSDAPVILHEGAELGLPGAIAANAPHSETTGRRAHIVIIDDDPLVCAAIHRFLKREHDVLSFTDARAGLEHLVASEGVDVVLCDLTMPDLTGMDVHAALSRSRPDVAARMVFLTGGAFTPATQAFLERSDVSMLDKPLSILELRGKLRALTAA